MFIFERRDRRGSRVVPSIVLLPGNGQAEAIYSGGGTRGTLAGGDFQTSSAESLVPNCITMTRGLCRGLQIYKAGASGAEFEGQFGRSSRQVVFFPDNGTRGVRLPRRLSRRMRPRWRRHRKRRERSQQRDQYKDELRFMAVVRYRELKLLIRNWIFREPAGGIFEACLRLRRDDILQRYLQMPGPRCLAPAAMGIHEAGPEFSGCLFHEESIGGGSTGNDG